LGGKVTPGELCPKEVNDATFFKKHVRTMAVARFTFVA